MLVRLKAFVTGTLGQVGAHLMKVFVPRLAALALLVIKRGLVMVTLSSASTVEINQSDFGSQSVEVEQ
jgi:hypothetical protein